MVENLIKLFLNAASHDQNHGQRSRISLYSLYIDQDPICLVEQRKSTEDCQKWSSNESDAKSARKMPKLDELERLQLDDGL